MPRRPNVLFLMSDEHSYRFLSARPPGDGGEPCSTPNLDSLVRRGTHCSTAYCQMPLCTPSRISMLCGRHSHGCGAWGNASVLDPALPTFASQLGNSGYATATVGKMHLGGTPQHAGFGARPYGDFGGPCGHQADPLDRPAADASRPKMSMRSRTLDAGVSQIPESMLQEQMVAREALAWLRETTAAKPQQPWLLYTAFSRPHFPLTAPSRFIRQYPPGEITRPRVGPTGDTFGHPMTRSAIRGFRTDEIGDAELMQARAAYFACVSFLDELMGDFLALLDHAGMLDNTVIVYASDHGEMAGEHGLFWKNTWHEASCRVPLIFSLPEQRRGELEPQVVDLPTSLVDIFPTLCGLTDTPPPAGLDGQDLSAALRGQPCPRLDQRPGVITESLAPRWGEGTEFRAIRSRRHKYVAFRGCADVAFDLEADPDEQHDLLAHDSPPEAVTALRDTVMESFDFGMADELRATAQRLGSQYAARVRPSTPNQILRGDGKLVEADQALYAPALVSAQPRLDFH
jgi:choline-sulfatase